MKILQDLKIETISLIESSSKLSVYSVDQGCGPWAKTGSQISLQTVKIVFFPQ